MIKFYENVDTPQQSSSSEMQTFHQIFLPFANILSMKHNVKAS